MIPKSHKYETSGIYKLACVGCNNTSVGQKGRSLNIRYKDHTRSTKYNMEESAFATHNKHQYGRMGNKMDFIKHIKKEGQEAINEHQQKLLHTPDAQYHC
jgi:hypothetical protein